MGSQFLNYMFLMLFGLKGCVQGYGDYSQLTSSGLDHNELFNDIMDYSKLPEDTVFQDETESRKVTGKVCWSVRKHLISVYSESNICCNSDSKFSLQSASSLCSLNTIQNNVREIETDLAEVHICQLFMLLCKVIVRM